MSKASGTKTSSASDGTKSRSKKTASTQAHRAVAAKKKATGKKAVAEKADLTDSVDKKPAKKKAAGKKVAASTASKTATKKASAAKKTVAKTSAAKTSVAKKGTSKKAAATDVADMDTSGSKTANPAAKAKTKARAKAKSATKSDASKTDSAKSSAGADDSSNTKAITDKKVARKAVSRKEDAGNVADAVEADTDDDMDSSELPAGLSKAPVPYERVAGHYMDAAQLTHFSKKLSEWKQQLMEEVDRTVDHMKDDATNFPDPNDRATQEEEFSLELRTRDRERKLIKKINEAQKRIDDDEYGYCETCGIEIGVNRLEARPTAELCIDCKTLEEIRERQNA